MVKVANFALEDLELRRLLSATYSLQQTVYDPSPVNSGQFGSNIATHGNLALVAAYQKTVNGVDLAGQVDLVDTTTGTVERVFDNPSGGGALLFGRGMTFVGDKIAIAAPEGANGAPGRVWIWDDASDTTPTEIDGSDGSTLFGGSLAAVGTDLLVGQAGGVSGIGRIFRYDTSGSLVNTYFDPQNASDGQFGNAVVTSGNTIYSSAQTDQNATQVPSVVGVDAGTGALTATMMEPGDIYQSWHQFGNLIAVSPVTGDVFVGEASFGVDPNTFESLYFDGVLQFHSDGSFVRLYQSPDNGTRGAQLFEFPAVTDTNQLVVGAPNSYLFSEDQTMVTQAGAVYVFDAGTGELQATIENPTPDFGDLVDDNDQYESFGAAVGALSNGAFVASDPTDNHESGFDTGVAYVFGPESVTPPNSAPVAGAITGPTTGVSSQVLSFSSSFTDADDRTTDPVTVAWDFGDGNVSTGSLAVQHAFGAAGTYTVTFTATDSHGASSSSQLVVSITSTGVVGNDLYVGGTSGSDTIMIDRNSLNQIVVGNQTFTIGGRVFIYAGAGNDTINVGSSVANDLYIDGGAGDDMIYGGHGNDVLIGGAGNDTLTGDVGRDLMIGGLGSDVLIGDSGDDVLIGGSTAYDNDPVALTAIMAEWTSGRSYTERVNNLLNGSGSTTRLNGNYFITPNVTTFDDGAVDSISGDGGQDWYVYDTDPSFADVLTTLQQNETSTAV